MMAHGRGHLIVAHGAARRRRLDLGACVATPRRVSRLVALVAVLLSACYEPTTRDCTLACSADGDCVSSQACTRDHFCADPTIATCAGRTVSDGGTAAIVDAARQSPPPPDGQSSPPPRDAMMPPPPDAGMPPPAPDARPPDAQLRVTVLGNGSVRVSVGAECSHGTCSYDVPLGESVTLTAVSHGNNVFREWQGLCAGQGMTCDVTASAPVLTTSAVFGHKH
ncbi:MAG TPA: hypothetical protein VFP84_16395 [Kofleriaceae bacterium]|nr:hypothetical protein [Kofleriaceae bacterium]